MTFPGADTIKGGIMGDDFFLSSAGAPMRSMGATSGSSALNWEDMVSTGEDSGVWVPCDEVRGG